MANGTWYWQHAYVSPEGVEEWSPVCKFTVDDTALGFNPPSFKDVLSRYSSQHPRVMMDAADWDDIIKRNKTNPEAQAFVKKATTCLSHPLKHLQEEVDTTNVVKLTNIVQRESALIRESRKIVDREEANMNALVRAYLLTKDDK